MCLLTYKTECNLNPLFPKKAFITVQTVSVFTLIHHLCFCEAFLYAVSSALHV